MNTRRPDVTVIIPTRNRRRMVLEAIDSCSAAAGNAVCQIVVVDDGGDDGTSEAIRVQHPEVTVFQLRRNRGPSVARNCGMNRATGRWLKFLDSDDRLEVGALESEVAAGDGSAADIVVSGWRILSGIMEDGSRRTLSTKGPPEVGDALADVFEEHVGHVGATLIRRGSVRGVWWDPSLRLLEDWDFFFRCVLVCRKRIALDQSVYQYVIHEEDRLSKPDQVMEYVRSHFVVVDNVHRALLRRGILPEEGRRVAQYYYKNLRLAWRFEPALGREVVRRILLLDPGFLPREHERSRSIKALCRVLPLEGVMRLYAMGRNALDPALDGWRRAFPSFSM